MVDFSLDRLMPDIAANSRRAVLNTVARAIAKDLNWHPLGMENLLHPDQSATHTPLGDGVMVVDICVDEIDRPYTLLAHLRHAVNVQAPDRRGVDLVLIMLSPARERSDHLRRVATAMRRLHDIPLRQALREATSLDMARLLLQAEKSDAAKVTKRAA